MDNHHVPREWVCSLEGRVLFALAAVGNDLSFGSNRFPAWGEVDVRADGSGVAVSANVLTAGVSQDVIASVFDRKARVTRTVTASPDGATRFGEARVGVAQSGQFVVSMNATQQSSPLGVLRFFQADGKPIRQVDLGFAIRGLDVNPAGTVVAAGVDAAGDVRVHRFDITGNQLGSQRIDIPASGATGVSAAVDAGGRYWLAWGVLGNQTTQVRARMFEPTGAARGGLLSINPASGTALVNPQVAVATNGSAVISTARVSTTNTSRIDLQGQRLSPAGTLSGRSFTMVSRANETSYDLAMNGAGSFGVIYRTGNRAFVRAFNANASVIGTAQVNQDARNTSTRQVVGVGGIGFSDRSITAGFFTWSYADSSRTNPTRGQAFFRRLSI